MNKLESDEGVPDDDELMRSIKCAGELSIVFWQRKGEIHMFLSAKPNRNLDNSTYQTESSLRTSFVSVI